MSGRESRPNLRAFVRVSTYGIDAEISRPDEIPGDADEAAMLDLSAGGVRLLTRTALALGECVVCHFELPAEACFALPAKVVRIDPAPPGRSGQGVALEFVGLPEEHRASLLRWIYREQVRRHR